MARIVPWLSGAVAAATAAGFTVLYLYRWEWHRAMFTTLVFIAVEILLVGGAVLRRIGNQATAAAEDERRHAHEQQVLDRLREARQERDHFAWLKSASSRTNVFVTIALGGGVVVTAGAWLVERVARMTGGRGRDEKVAAALAELAFPADGLVADDAELAAQPPPYADHPQLRRLLGPTGSRR